jgi:hypothetical protein
MNASVSASTDAVEKRRELELLRLVQNRLRMTIGRVAIDEIPSLRAGHGCLETELQKHSSSDAAMPFINPSVEAPRRDGVVYPTGCRHEAVGGTESHDSPVT